MGEYFRDSGRHALCIYDDLSNTLRPTGSFPSSCAVARREAYPEIFFISILVSEESG